MALSIGDKLGHLKVVGPLGAGGMGEVYRALDTQLDREVAVKVLPQAMARDPERLARFDREAKILAALNHPNIAVIHGMEKFEGGRALIMELVPGDTLGARIKRGAMPVEEALNIAKQMAEALEAAHEKGVTHRDLKPGNVMITPTGLVKVLDFGLAAMSAPSASVPGDPENSPTLTMGMTQAGAIMGTAAYMSPEQAAGTPVDRRADIWSYGVVLWEMLTGKRLFGGGESISHTLADVLRAPIDFDAISAGPLRKLLKRCLDRSLKTRLQSIAEARILIDEILVNPEGEPAILPPSDARSRLPWVAAGVLLLTSLALGMIHFREVPPPQLNAVKTTLLPPDGGEFDFEASSAIPAISPDGTRIVYAVKAKDGKHQLWLRRLDSDTAQPLPGTEDPRTPFWSPDSRWVAFGQTGKLKKIDIQGGSPVTITDAPSTPSGGSWNQQGVIIFFISSNAKAPIFRVPATGGEATPITPETLGRSPWYLPDGIHFLYTLDSDGADDGDITVLVGSLDSPGKPGKVVARANSTAVYAQGHLLYLREGKLMAQPFDLAQLATQGEPMPVAEGIGTLGGGSRVSIVGVSSSGLLVYGTRGAGQGRLVWKDRQGKELGNIPDFTLRPGDFSLSPDGKLVAAAVGIPGGAAGDIWMADVARGAPTRFTFGPGNAIDVHWSMDGAILYFRSNRNKGVWDLYRKASNGNGTEELVLADSANKRPLSVSPDGKLLLFSRNDPNTKQDLWVLPVAQPAGGTKPKPQVFLQTPFNEDYGKFSPDGKWVVYESNESGQKQIYAASFPGPGGKRQISSASGGIIPLWSKDGKEIFYTTASGQMMAAPVAVHNGILEVGKVQMLFEGGFSTGSWTWDVSADGQKFLVREREADTHPLTLLQNWTSLLKK